MWSYTQRHKAITETMINIKFSTNYTNIFNGGMSQSKSSVSMRNFVMNDTVCTSAEHGATRSEVTLAELRFHFL